MNKKISVVIPCYNGGAYLKSLTEAIKSNISTDLNYEIIIVNDGSTDNTEALIQNIIENDNNIKGISLKKNFGQQAALICGIKHATGDAVITMDDDFQHPPEKIQDLIKHWESGHDLVICRKENVQKEDSIVIVFFRVIGYKLYTLVGDNKILPGVSDYRIMDKHIVEALNSLEESRFIIRGLVMLYSKNPKYIGYIVPPRRGKSRYNFQKLYNLLVNTLTSFSLKPLKFAMAIGMSLIVISFLYLGYVVYVRIFHGENVVQGFSALIFVNITLFGFLFFYLGVLSEYIGTIFDEVKKRPKYIIHRKFNIE